ncbi:MAG: sigma-70 family RNA polymerase sigma factor [Fusobacteriota bacterium]
MYEEQKLGENLINAAQSGEESALSEIFDRYKSFVYFKARNYFLMGGDKEDLIQEGMIGLLNAIRGYDEEGLASFRTFASICIKRQLITAIKSANANKHTPLNKATEMNSGKDEAKLSSHQKNILESYIFYNPEELLFTKEEILKLQSYLEDHLSDFEFDVFKLLVNGYTYIDISEKLSKDAKSIDNAIQRIRNKSESWIKVYKNN